MIRDLSTLDRDICQPLGRILQEAFSDGMDNVPRINIKFDSLQYEGDIIGFQVRPAANVAKKPDGTTDATAVIYGAQFMPRFNPGVPGNSLVGLFANPILKGAAGDLSGDFRAIEAKIESEPNGARTIKGIASIFDVKQALYGTYDKGVYVLKVDAAGGGVAWTALATLPDDSKIAKKATSPQAFPNSNAAYIRVEIGGTVYRLEAYTDE